MFDIAVYVDEYIGKEWWWRFLFGGWLCIPQFFVVGDGTILKSTDGRRGGVLIMLMIHRNSMTRE